MTRIVPHLLLIAMVGLCAPRVPSALAQAGLPTPNPAPARPVPWGEIHPEPLIITTADGAEVAFAVELAISPEEWARGLMFREAMPADRGMLFTGKAPHTTSFWMENTLIPLDMLFIAPDGRIRRIEANAEPLTRTGRPSGGPITAVLEINGGRAAALGIRPGDQVRHPMLRTY